MLHCAVIMLCWKFRVLVSVSHCKGSNAPSVMSLMVDEGRMRREDHFLPVLFVSFSAVGCVTLRASSLWKSMSLIPRCSLPEKMEEDCGNWWCVAEISPFARVVDCSCAWSFWVYLNFILSTVALVDCVNLLAEILSQLWIELQNTT